MLLTKGSGNAQRNLVKASPGKEMLGLSSCPHILSGLNYFNKAILLKMTPSVTTDTVFLASFYYPSNKKELARKSHLSVGLKPTALQVWNMNPGPRAQED